MKILRTIKLLILITGLIWLLFFVDGLNSGRAWGLVMVMGVLLIFLLAKDTKKYHARKHSWGQAAYLSFKENIKYVIG